jgi:hypothetical protein
MSNTIPRINAISGVVAGATGGVTLALGTALW